MRSIRWWLLAWLCAGGMLSAGDYLSLRLVEAFKDDGELDPKLVDVGNLLTQLPFQGFKMVDEEDVKLPTSSRSNGMNVGEIRRGRPAGGMSLSGGGSKVKFAKTLGGEYTIKFSGTQDALSIVVERRRQTLLETTVSLADNTPFISVLPGTRRSGGKPVIIIIARGGSGGVASTHHDGGSESGDGSGGDGPIAAPPAPPPRAAPRP